MRLIFQPFYCTIIFILLATSTGHAHVGPKDKQPHLSTSRFINDYHPMYQFRLENLAAKESEGEVLAAALDFINVVPKPYYGFSDYETAANTGVVKIINLPAKCSASIYSLEGQFIRQFERNGVGLFVNGNHRAIRR